MIPVLSGLLYRETNIKNGYYVVKNLLQLYRKHWNLNTSKWFSAGNSLQHENRDDFTKPERTLPTLIYIQNPITWLINKIDFKMLKRAWDSDFEEEEFKRGTKQAIAVICALISKNLWDNLRGLVTRQALIRLRRDVDVHWSDEQRRNIYLEASDIKIALPRKVHFLKIGDQKFVDVDMMCVAMKFKEEEPSNQTDFILIEMVARFHRNYTDGELPNWTVTLFKVTRFIIRPGQPSKVESESNHS